MTFTFEVLVTLKAGLADPAGKAVEAALPTMGWTTVHDVHVGKHIKLTVEGPDETAARAQVEEIAQRLLSNPVIENYRVLDQPEA
ncbi:MAG: phosphoribosylformylglycinamidine synthase subunit PurS [Actinomycetota bacterium]|jgi:phosphoribosylformylglycinamidine synthase|nr:phosphoribosylformylglycinamidine synthase subunit PurS [Actinomycetota bacterium]